MVVVCLPIENNLNINFIVILSLIRYSIITGMILGCIYMALIAIFFTNTAYLLSETWNIMRDRWVIYDSHCRQPYPEIGMRSFGPKMKQAIYIYNSTIFKLCLNAE